MAAQKIMDRIKQGHFIIDGAMGTQLMSAGIRPGVCNDYVNIESPEIVTEIHARYLDAGCDGIITNTFGANAYALKRHGHDHEVYEINKAGAEVARKAAGSKRYVLGDIGPTGDFLKPLGNIDPGDLRETFSRQVKGLVDGGADAVIIETMTALDELIVAAEAVKSVTDLPLFVSMSYDPAGDGFRTMMGVSPAQAYEKLSTMGISAIGFNCGTLEMEQYVQLAKEYKSIISDDSIVLLAEPNAGKPELIDGKPVYKLTPDQYAAYAVRIRDAGAGILGGCCGTSPEHIGAMAGLIRGS